MPWALRGAVASLAIPMLRDPDGLGFADWDFVLDKFEAVRAPVLVWHQFPWWNPWCRGGFPLAAEPADGACRWRRRCVLALGTGIGLRIAAILCMLIAVEGAYRLAWLWFRGPWSSAAAGIDIRAERRGLREHGRGLHHRHELWQPAVAGLPSPSGSARDSRRGAGWDFGRHSP